MLLQDLQEQIRKMRLRGVTAVALSEENRLVLGRRPTRRPSVEAPAPVAMPSLAQRGETLRRFQQAQQPQAPQAQSSAQPRQPQASRGTSTPAPGRRPVAESSYPAPADVSQASWEELECACRTCAGCGLQTEPREIFFESGCRQAPLMVIGDGSRKTVDENGAVVESAEDTLLWNMIHAMGRDRESTDPATSVYVASVVKCVIRDERNASSHRTVRNSEAQACRGHLLRQIALVRPRVIVAFGGITLAALFGGGSILELRGRWQEFQGIPVMPTYSPGFVLGTAQNQNKEKALKRLVWQDLKLAMAKLAETAPAT